MQALISLLKGHNLFKFHQKAPGLRKDISAFTIIELFVVFLLIGISAAILVIRTGTYSYWRQESFIRQLSDTLVFLHHQAISDQSFYRIEFDFEKQSFSVGSVQPDYDYSNPQNIDFDAGVLSLEIASIISPSIGSGNISPPASFPSLAKPVELPPELMLTEIRTPRGKQTKEEGVKPYIYFSPRGFSEFAVLHMKTGEDKDVTVLINPFTGNTTIYREYKDFEWTYDRKKKT